MKNIIFFISLSILFCTVYASPIGDICEGSSGEPVCGLDLSSNELYLSCDIHFCPVSYKTYDNDCYANLGGYTLYTGTCLPLLDSFGCITSSGYVWSQSETKCIQNYNDYALTYTDFAMDYDLLYRNGITTMQSLEKFRPDDFITREEAAKLFSLSTKLVSVVYTGETKNCEKYKDEGLFDVTLQPYVYNLCQLNIMKGSQGYFMPHNKITGAETLAISMRLVDGRQDETQESYRRMGYAEKLYNQIRKNPLNKEMITSLQDPMTRKEFISFILSIYNEYRSIEKNILKLPQD